VNISYQVRGRKHAGHHDREHTCTRTKIDVMCILTRLSLVFCFVMYVRFTYLFEHGPQVEQFESCYKLLQCSSKYKVVRSAPFKTKKIQKMNLIGNTQYGAWEGQTCLPTRILWCLYGRDLLSRQRRVLRLRWWRSRRSGVLIVSMKRKM